VGEAPAATAAGLPGRTLTVLIADLRGYTAYTHQHGDAAGAAVATRFAQLAGAAVSAQVGQVVETRGDEVLAVLGSSRNALRAAVDLLARCAAAPDFPLQAGVGLDAGEPVPVPGGYRGEAINVAARLCASAGAGEVLASGAVISLARRIDGLAFDERGPMDLKGIPHPVRAWRVRAEAASGQEEQAASWVASSPVESLLTTKLAIPLVCGCLIARPRLMERLRAGLQGPLTLLSAPAGSGKTTLLSAWRASPEGRDLPLAWVSLDEADNDPARFWRYVLTALDRAARGVGGAALRLLHASDTTSMEAVLTALLNALTAQARNVVLILDDYHLIEAEPIHRALASLLAHLPRCLHLLLATRADPPLPLARLRARGEVTELRAADLGFTAEETAAFLGTVTGLSFSPDEVAAL
jgi:class 3 adenylate cyclase